MYFESVRTIWSERLLSSTFGWPHVEIALFNYLSTATTHSSRELTAKEKRDFGKNRLGSPEMKTLVLQWL